MTVMIECAWTTTDSARRGARDVRVDLSSDSLDVRVCGDVVAGLVGELFAPVKAEASTWVISDGVRKEGKEGGGVVVHS